jgi:hypothetical protein
MLRFAGGLHIVGGRIVIEAELDTANGPSAPQATSSTSTGTPPRCIVLAAGGLRKGSALCRAGGRRGRGAGPPDRARRRPRPPGARPCRPRSSPAHLRLRGRLAGRLPRARLPHRARPLVLPRDHLPRSGGGPRARRRRPRLGIAAKAREVRGVDRVVIRDGDAIGAMLTRLGAHERSWPGRSAGCVARSGRPRTGSRTSTTRTCAARRGPRWPPGPGSSGRWRSSATTSRPPAEAGQLRVEHKQASLEELGQLADPPMTKDAVAGRIRRLLAMADKRAQRPRASPAPRPACRRHARRLRPRLLPWDGSAASPLTLRYRILAGAEAFGATRPAGGQPRRVSRGIPPVRWKAAAP